MEKAVETAVEDKVEGGAKSALRQIFGPHPGLALLRFWQGIVELCLTIAVVVSGNRKRPCCLAGIRHQSYLFS